MTEFIAGFVGSYVICIFPDVAWPAYVSFIL